MNEQQLLENIASLAGAINQYKNEKEPTQVLDAAKVNKNTRSYPYSVSRNYSFILNKSNRSKSTAASPPYVIPSTSSNADDANKEPEKQSTSDYVSRKNRHMQLIKKNILEHDLQARKANLESYRAKLEKEYKTLAENKIQQRLSDGTKQLVTIDGLQYITGVSDTKWLEFVSAKGQCPKYLYWNNKSYLLKKKRFLKEVGNSPSAVYCRYYNANGICGKGAACRFVHEPTRKTICPKFLNGRCNKAEDCNLSHELDPRRIPACRYFLLGKCNNPNCRYVHIHYSENAPICFEFAKYGFCELGTSCKNQHILQCTDYAMFGSCNNPQCSLYHGAVFADIPEQIEAPISKTAGSINPEDSGSEIGSNSLESNLDFISV
ncbi:ZC3H3 protein [Schizosaccharomyces pombe]